MSLFPTYLPKTEGELLCVMIYKTKRKCFLSPFHLMMKWINLPSIPGEGDLDHRPKK